MSLISIVCLSESERECYLGWNPEMKVPPWPVNPLIVSPQLWFHRRSAVPPPQFLLFQS